MYRRFISDCNIYKAEIGQRGLNKCPKMQQCRECPLSFHGNQQQGTLSLFRESSPGIQ